MSAVRKIQYTGLNFHEVKQMCGDMVLAPYICMGFSMLSLYTEEGFVSVNEGDTIVMDEKGNFSIEK